MRHILIKRKKKRLPYAKTFTVDARGNQELCNSTGYEVVFHGYSDTPENTWNEYKDSRGEKHYGR